MNKKGKNIEMRIYELLGVKNFRKLVFWLYKLLSFPFTIFMSKETRKKYYSSPNNYNMKKGHGLQDLRDFKWMLLLNASVHILILVNCLLNFLIVVTFAAPISTAIINLTGIGINIYCIMLQRYNHIRINQVLKKGEAREKKQKDSVLEEIKQENNIFNDLTHKIVDKKDKEIDITFEEFFQIATVQQLKYYKETLEHAKRYYDYLQQIDEPPGDITIPLKKGRSLKLEIKPNQSAVN